MNSNLLIFAIKYL